MDSVNLGDGVTLFGKDVGLNIRAVRALAHHTCASATTLLGQ